MKLPRIEKPDKYVGLYVVDFGESSGVGFTADEVAELFESEKYRDCKAYKIHKAYPDGRLELKGVGREVFQLEAGMLFYAADSENARADYKRLVKLGVETDVPCRAKINLAKLSGDKYVTAMIYPAEYDDEMSGWLLKHNYKTAGQVDGGVSVITQYYQAKPEIIERHQFWPASSIESRTGQELLAAVKVAVQR